MSYIIALDSGTTSVRAFLYDTERGRFVHRAQQEVENKYPHPGWVEQDADEIWYKAAYVVSDCLRVAGGSVAGMGITNQRETVVAWNAKTGEPICPTIVWQCRRTSAYCASIPKEDAKLIKQKTGLLPDAYFSASKIKWILENVPEAGRLMKEGALRVGTVDTFLIWKLTEGKSFVTDYTNASRTMLFNLFILDWDEELLAYFQIPREILAEPRPSNAKMGEATVFRGRFPITGTVGDQQSALFGQSCCEAGEGKITYGTGLFMLFATGKTPVFSAHGLLTTVAVGRDGSPAYALEGSMFHAGSGVQWLRDEMGLIETASESERLAMQVEDTGGVYFVPAFTGLGAPYWDSDARGLIAGITRGTRKEHIVRAVLESIAYGARDLADCMTRDSKLPLVAVRVDGGASANNFLMQFQADVLGIPVDRPVELESTALGAATLAAQSLGISVSGERATERLFTPSLNRPYFDGLYASYRDAVRRTLLK